jgi:hypothetical protein
MKKTSPTTGFGNTLCQLRLVLLALIILSCPFAVAAQRDFSSVNAFLKATLKGGGQLSFKARGDLNGDGLEDWAGVIRRQLADASATYQLYVLLRQARGGYRVAEKSIEAEIPGMGCCWAENLEIRRNSIYIQNNAKTVSVMEAVTHKFKLYQGEWRLVGIRIYLTDFTPDAEGKFESDMNLLTGLVIERNQEGIRKPVVKNRQQKFATYLLKDFDFSTRFGNEEPSACN